MLTTFRKLTRYNPENIFALKRKAADNLIAAQKYIV